MKLIVGLGNPGREYAGTPHNIGFDVVDAVAGRHGLSWESSPEAAVMTRWRSAGAILAKPLTFMNLSGHAVGGLLRYFRIEPLDLLVVVDEVNLELGRLRMRERGSAGGHNGLKSLIDQMGTSEFARLRIGVGRGEGRRNLSSHVLARFAAEDRAAVAETVDRSADAVEVFIAEGAAAVMNRFNRKEDGD